MKKSIANDLVVLRKSKFVWARRFLVFCIQKVRPQKFVGGANICALPPRNTMVGGYMRRKKKKKVLKTTMSFDKKKSFSEHAGPVGALQGVGPRKLAKARPRKKPPRWVCSGAPSRGSPGFLPAPAPLGAGAKRKGLESHLLLPRSKARVPCPPFGAGHAKVEGSPSGQVGKQSMHP